MNYQKWKQLSDEGYSSDAISFLTFIKNGEELDEEHLKTQAVLSLLKRKELINDNKLTILGEELLINSDTCSNIVFKRKIKSDKFEDWWRIYPATDSFIYNGVEFPGTQSKKIKKELCATHFNKIINEGISGEDIIKATEYHIEQAKKLSVKRGASQISFIPNSERYLREKCFEHYIGLNKQEKEETFKSNII